MRRAITSTIRKNNASFIRDISMSRSAVDLRRSPLIIGADQKKEARWGKRASLDQLVSAYVEDGNENQMIVECTEHVSAS